MVPPFTQPRNRLPVLGYHGTTAAAAELALAEGFIPSENEYDWLGDGVYFFQDAPHRAAQWAWEQHGPDAVVVEARIEMSRCLDLLDIEHFAVLNAAHDQIVRLARQRGIPLPRQTGGAHRMDRYVINTLCTGLAPAGQDVHVVRGAFQEGRPAFPNSALFDRSHVQLAVRDTTALSEVRMLDREELQ